MRARRCLVLPGPGQTRLPASAPAEAPQVPPHGLSFLVYAPAPNVAATVANLLEPFGNKVVVADSAADATARGAQENFDV